MNAFPTPQSLRVGRADAPVRCTVGLLTWNGGAEVEHCIAALLAQDEPAFEILWVDNASTNDCVARLQARFAGTMPAAAVNPRNNGFCGGHNQLLRACRTPFYLALNQDAALSPDYLRRLCDWMQAEPRLALASGLVLQAAEAGERIESVGLAWPRLRMAFLLGLDRPVTPADRLRREVSGVIGAAMLLRVAACRDVSLGPDSVFPDDFFAYFEEIDLAQRLGRNGFACGVEGGVTARHVSASSGGKRQRPIQAKYIANHWLLTLRHDGLALLLRELPWLLYGELRWWLPRYLRQPLAFLQALGDFLRRAIPARRFYHTFERRHGPTQARLATLRMRARRELEESNRDKMQ